MATAGARLIPERQSTPSAFLEPDRRWPVATCRMSTRTCPALYDWTCEGSGSDCCVVPRHLHARGRRWRRLDPPHAGQRRADDRVGCAWGGRQRLRQRVPERWRRMAMRYRRHGGQRQCEFLRGSVSRTSVLVGDQDRRRVRELKAPAWSTGVCAARGSSVGTARLTGSGRAAFAGPIISAAHLRACSRAATRRVDTALGRRHDSCRTASYRSALSPRTCVRTRPRAKRTDMEPRDYRVWFVRLIGACCVVAGAMPRNGPLNLGPGFFSGLRRFRTSAGRPPAARSSVPGCCQ
jgi:hypothetical protein